MHIINAHGSHRSWHTLFKDFSRTFEVHFQGLFKDFSLFFQTFIRKKKDQQWTFQNKTYRDHLILSLPEKLWGEIWVCVFNFLDDLLYYGYNTAQTILLEREVWGSSLRKILLELVQNPAILDYSGG